jgi:plastocyanin
MVRVSSNRKMRRALAVLAVAALGVALFGGTRPVDDAHAATSCTKHSKRVVKHVKRHGKRKRVVQLKHWWTCQEVAEPVASTPVAPSPPTPPPETPAAAPEPQPNAVGVVARDANKHFTFEPSRTTVKAGRLTVQLINEGEDPHTMDMQRIGPGGTPEGEVVQIPETASKHQSVESVEVQPGRYRMWCTLFHHAEEGMETEITVE